MSADLNLSQEELEALRQGIADGSIASNAGVMPDGEVAPYAFGSDEERSFGELNALHLLTERQARGMRVVFQPMMRVQPKVSAAPVLPGSFENYSDGFHEFSRPHILYMKSEKR